MFDVCPHCGLYDEAKTVDPDGPDAICPHCAHRHRFEYRPLLVLTGASGTGKSTVCLAMAQRWRDCVWLETDVFWGPAFDTPENDYQHFRNTCLRAAKTINQSGKPTVLCGSSTPGQFESCPQARYFKQIHYLALVCNEAELQQRLAARPAWRDSSSAAFIQRMVTFNQWFTDHADSISELSLLDTSGQTLDNTCATVTRWVVACLL